MTRTAVVPESIVAVTLGSHDIASQRRFYEAWGWSAVPYSTDEYVAFSLSGTMLAFFVAEKLGEEAAPGQAVLPPGAWNGVTLAVSVPEKNGVDVTWRAAVAAGATAVAEPVDRPWGGRSGYVADPEGNRWEIAWIPPMSSAD
jgi:catechol 2,3-dioxygenase-like lactoylglutathione lyase family enzyme